ncbi:MAG: translation initiation factor IF-2 N-terminal domain-containing protein [Acidobacteria bacterium]|nr:translation initiation factor IF-2 N-terminal domain-containing protein [Acidobacteriota bacterium]
MSTVRIYKVAELLATSSQEVLALLKQNHGIELKSASSTLEEIVARQFVDRLARQRGIELPKGDIFSEAAAKAVKKSGGPTSKKAAPEPPKPAAPSLPPPRLIKTMRPPVVPVAASPVEGAEAGEAEMVLPELEPVFEQPGMNAAVIDETDTVVPPSTHGPRPSKSHPPPSRRPRRRRSRRILSSSSRCLLRRQPSQPDRRPVRGASFRPVFAFASRSLARRRPRLRRCSPGGRFSRLNLGGYRRPPDRPGLHRLPLAARPPVVLGRRTRRALVQAPAPRRP